MRARRAVHFVVLQLLSAASLFATIIPTLDLSELTTRAELIVVGEVISIRDKGQTKIEVAGHYLSASLMTGEARVDQVLKGHLNSASVTFEFLLPNPPIGFEGVRPSDYRPHIARDLLAAAFDPQLIVNYRGCHFPKRQKPFLHPEALEWLVIQNSNA